MRSRDDREGGEGRRGEYLRWVQGRASLWMLNIADWTECKSQKRENALAIKGIGFVRIEGAEGF